MKNLLFFQTKIVLFIFCIASFSQLQAVWDPGYVDDYKPIYKEREFVRLRDRVFKALEKSWCSREKAQLLMELVALTKPKLCVEIGAFSGSSVLPVAAALKFLERGEIFAIDAWSNEDAVRYFDYDDNHRAWWSTVDMLEAQSIFMDRIDNWKLGSYCTMIKSPSEGAVHRFDKIDFIHFDGDLSEQGSLQDVKLYLPKVRPGGYILFSNVFYEMKGKRTKMRAFCYLFESCDLICEIDNGDTALFRKR